MGLPGVPVYRQRRGAAARPPAGRQQGLAAQCSPQLPFLPRSQKQGSGTAINPAPAPLPEQVKRELPDATQRFARIDTDIKGVLREFKATQNCVACCNKEGLLKFLEGQQAALEVRAAAATCSCTLCLSDDTQYSLSINSIIICACLVPDLTHRCARRRWPTTWSPSGAPSPASTLCPRPTCWTSCPTATARTRSVI